MKKFLTFLTASLLLVLFALPVGAASRAELSEASREKLDTFFSNFAEARVGSFVMNNEIPMDTFVDFGVQHNIINRKYDLVNVNEGYWGVKKEAVENAVFKYFGRRINAVSSRQHKLTNNLYLVPKASGKDWSLHRLLNGMKTAPTYLPAWPIFTPHLPVLPAMCTARLSNGGKKRRKMFRP